jgi:hypothetical protein
MPVYGKGRRTQTLMRVTATDGEETWVYQYPEEYSILAMSRIMHDMRDEKIPGTAGEGLLRMISEAMNSAD